MKRNQNPLWRNGQLSSGGDSKQNGSQDTQNPTEQARSENERSSKSKRSK